jgi:hypothetical protein
MNRRPRLIVAPARGDVGALAVVAGAGGVRCASARATGMALRTSSCCRTDSLESRLTPRRRASAETSLVRLRRAGRRRPDRDSSRRATSVSSRTKRRSSASAIRSAAGSVRTRARERVAAGGTVAEVLVAVIGIPFCAWLSEPQANRATVPPSRPPVIGRSTDRGGRRGPGPGRARGVGVGQGVTGPAGSSSSTMYSQPEYEAPL